MDLPESPQYIRDIICLGTRRTSRYVFDNCMNDIIAAVQNFNVNGDPIVLADIEGYVQEAQYAFGTLRQKIQQRKYREDFDALWPFIGIPIHIVSDGLGVSVERLEGRIQEGARIWPEASDGDYILLLVQYAIIVAESDSDSGSDGWSSDGVSSDGWSSDGVSSDGVSSDGVSSGGEEEAEEEEAEEDYEVLTHEFFRVPRGFLLNEVHDYLRLGLMTEVNAYDQLLQTEMHSEIGGIRYGPLVTEDQWQQVVYHEENYYKVNIIFVQTNR